MIDEATTTRPAPPLIGARGGASTEYRDLPEGPWRFMVGEPKLKQIWVERNGKGDWATLVQFPLTLTESEKKRLEDEYGEPPKGMFQSWKPAFGGYSCGYTLNPRSSGEEANLVTFLAACYGQQNQRQFREWIKNGGCPTVNAPTNEGRFAQIESWLKWVEGAEVYGTIAHRVDNKRGGTLARFGGPMPVGGVPGGPKEPEYQSTMKGKLRAMMTDEPAPTNPETVEEAVELGASIARAADISNQGIGPADDGQPMPTANSVKGCTEHGTPQAGCTDCFDALMGAPATS